MIGKSDQDSLDACLCLLVALHLTSRRACTMVGNVASGDIVVPSGVHLDEELNARCVDTSRAAKDWVRTLRG